MLVAPARPRPVYLLLPILLLLLPPLLLLLLLLPLLPLLLPHLRVLDLCIMLSVLEQEGLVRVERGERHFAQGVTHD